MVSDHRRDTAVRLLEQRLGILPLALERYPTGLCHSVYRVRAQGGEWVLRVTGQAARAFYEGSVIWLPALERMDLPVPRLLEHGEFEDVCYALVTLLPGKDLGDVYDDLSAAQKRQIARSLAQIQSRVGELPSPGRFGYSNPAETGGFARWGEFLRACLLDRARRRMGEAGVFDPALCDGPEKLLDRLMPLLDQVSPRAFLDDATTKNVLIHQGALAGVVDIDAVCFGDPLLAVGLIRTSLQCQGKDTLYIDALLAEMGDSPGNRTLLDFYTLLYCLDFMGEQGQRFDNGHRVDPDPRAAERLLEIYRECIVKL